MTDRTECQRFQLLLSEQLDRVLSPEELEELSAHLASCEDCRELAAALRVSDSLARESPPPAPLAGECLQQLVDGVMAEVEENKDEAFPAPLRGMPNWRELLGSWGFPSVAGVVALAVLAFFLLRSPQAPLPTTTGKGADKDLLAPAESSPMTPADSETPAQVGDEKHARFEPKENAPVDQGLRKEQATPQSKKAAEAEPASRESLNEQLPASLDEQSNSRIAAAGSVRATQPADSLAALHALGVRLPLSEAQRDSLHGAWNARLKESADSTEQEQLRAALEALKKLPPLQD